MRIFEKLQRIIADTLNVPLDMISENLAVGAIPQWDSMGNMAIIAAIEEQMGIEFPLDDLFELNSVRALVDEIEKLS